MLEERAQDLIINMRGLLPLIVSNALNVLGTILILLIGTGSSLGLDRHSQETGRPYQSDRQLCMHHRKIVIIVGGATNRGVETRGTESLLTCMGVFLSSGFLFVAGSLFGAERPFLVPSPAIRFPERAEGVKGPKC